MKEITNKYLYQATLYTVILNISVLTNAALAATPHIHTSTMDMTNMNSDDMAEMDMGYTENMEDMNHHSNQAPLEKPTVSTETTQQQHDMTQMQPSATSQTKAAIPYTIIDTVVDPSPTQHTAHKMTSSPLFAFWAKHLESNFVQKDTTDQSISTLLDAEFWYGNDRQKLLIKTDTNYNNSNLWQSSNDVLYSRAWLPFWNVEMGLHADIVQDTVPLERKTDTQYWLAAGVSGTMPYNIENTTTAYLNHHGDIQIKTKLEKDLYITQKWLLQPALDITLDSTTDKDRQQHQGVADYKTALRLLYKVTPQFLPYLGVTYEHNYAIDRTNSDWLAGITFWF